MTSYCKLFLFISDASEKMGNKPSEARGERCKKCGKHLSACKSWKKINQYDNWYWGHYYEYNYGEYYRKKGDDDAYHCKKCWWGAVEEEEDRIAAEKEKERREEEERKRREQERKRKEEERKRKEEEERKRR